MAQHTIKGTEERELRACGSSIAHGSCVYAGENSHGVCQCDAPERIRKRCPFKGRATILAHLAMINERNTAA